MKKRTLPVDYINECGNIPFSLIPFSEADTSAFCMFLLMDINRIGIPKENKEGFITFEDAVNNQIKLHGKKKYGLLLPTDINELLTTSSTALRYKDVRFYNLYNKVDDVTQSTYVMCDITPDITLVIFGGTDDTVVGWKEDLDLLVSHNVECLKNAEEYIKRNCQNKNKKYIFLGHSKGGMISTHCFFNADDKIRERIISVYDLDGPGFTEDYLCDHLDDPLMDRLKLICPRESFVGRLFFQPKPAIVIKSINKGLMQHNPTGWVVDGDHFLRVNKFSKRATVKAVMAYKYMNNLSEEDKKNFVSGITKIAQTGNAKTLSTLILRPLSIFRTAVHLPKAERRQVFSLPFKLVHHKREAQKEARKRK